MMNGMTAVHTVASGQSRGTEREHALRPSELPDDGSPSFSQALREAMARHGRRVGGGRFARANGHAEGQDQAAAGSPEAGTAAAGGPAWTGEPVPPTQLLATGLQEPTASVSSEAEVPGQGIGLTISKEGGLLQAAVSGDPGSLVASTPSEDQAAGGLMPGSPAEQPGLHQEPQLTTVPGGLSAQPASGEAGSGQISMAQRPAGGHGQKATASVAAPGAEAQPGLASNSMTPGSEGQSRFQALKPWWAIEAEMILKIGNRGYIRSGVLLQSREITSPWSMPSRWAAGGELAAEGGRVASSSQGIGSPFLQLVSQHPGLLSSDWEQHTLGWAHDGGETSVPGGPLPGSGASGEGYATVMDPSAPGVGGPALDAGGAVSQAAVLTGGALHEATSDGAVSHNPALPGQDGAAGTPQAADLPGVAATHSDGVGVSNGRWEAAARWAHRPVDGNPDVIRAEGGLARATVSLESGSAASPNAEVLADEVMPAGEGRRPVSPWSTASPDADAVVGVSTGRQSGYGAQDGKAGLSHLPGTGGEALSRVSSEGADRSATSFQEVLARSDTRTAETLEPKEGSSASSAAWATDARVQGHTALPVSETGGEAATPASPDWAREIVRLVQRTRPDGTQEAFLQLQPEHLGKLLVRVTVQQGRVSVQIRAESEATEALLRSHLGLLRHALEEQGLRLDHVQLETLGRDDGLSQAGYQGQGHPSGEHPRNPQPARPAWGVHRSYQGEESTASGVQPVGAAGSIQGRSGIDLRV